jgi:23S rRNA (guanine745-N1)-methyltransferase
VPALDQVLPLLRCPHCGAGLGRRDRDAVSCEAGHSFDIARQGYLSLLPGTGSAHTGDTADMVGARERFLEAGHFEPVAEAIASALAERIATPPDEAEAAPLVVDLGAGTGWYLARLLDRFPGALGLALDVSKPALRRGARLHPRVAAAAADVWRPLPLRDGAAAVIIDVFAPRDPAEVARVLGPDGVALFVTPAPGHLQELVERLGLLAVDPDKDERLAAQLAPHLTVLDRRRLAWTLDLDRAAARDGAAMGPSAFHVSPAALDERAQALPQLLEVTAAVDLTLTTAAAPRARPPAPAAAASGPTRRRIPPATRPPRSPGDTG